MPLASLGAHLGLPARCFLISGEPRPEAYPTGSSPLQVTRQQRDSCPQDLAPRSVCVLASSGRQAGELLIATRPRTRRRATGESGGESFRCLCARQRSSPHLSEGSDYI